MIRRPPRSTQSRSSAASDVYKRQALGDAEDEVAAGRLYLPAGQALGVEAARRRRDDVVGGDVARGDARGGHPRDGDVTERLAATVAGRHGLGLTGAQPVVQVAGEPPPFDDL